MRKSSTRATREALPLPLPQTESINHGRDWYPTQLSGPSSNQAARQQQAAQQATTVPLCQYAGPPTLAAEIINKSIDLPLDSIGLHGLPQVQIIQ